MHIRNHRDCDLSKLKADKISDEWGKIGTCPCIGQEAIKNKSF